MAAVRYPLAARPVALLVPADRRFLLIAGGFLAILPVFGLWMLPLGLALIADDVPWLKARLEQAARWCEKMWHRLPRRR
jgi:hypothetical protein